MNFEEEYGAPAGPIIEGLYAVGMDSHGIIIESDGGAYVKGTIIESCGGDAIRIINKLSGSKYYEYYRKKFPRYPWAE